VSEVVLRWAPQERTLRSTGDLAGIIALSYPDDGPTFSIDAAWEPHSEAADTVVTTFADGISPTATPVSIEQCVRGCATPAELTHLWLFTVQGVHRAIAYLFGSQSFDLAHASIDFIERVASAIETELTRRGDEPS
jgi:hypothetical protein